MTGVDWLIVAVMLTAVAATIVFDRVVARRQHSDQAEDHRRLMAEVRRQP